MLIEQIAYQLLIQAYYVCFVHAAALARLDGVLLQWSVLFEPYGLNFVQYRRVSNLTLSVTGNDDITPFSTLAMAFQSGSAHQFTVPRSGLVDGAYYEFRMGYPFTAYTYYTNSLIVKTYDVNSPYVGNVQSSSTDTQIVVSWTQPEYSDGIVGYAVTVLYQQAGNGGLTNPGWNPNALNTVTSARLSLTQTSIVVGCIDLSALNCLQPYTTYLFEIAVIRQSGQDAPKAVYVSTEHSIPSRHNSSLLFLYGGWITMNFTVAVPLYNNASIGSTFLGLARLATVNGDLQLNLTSSTVTSITDTSLKITMSYSEYQFIMAYFAVYTNLWSAARIYYGNSLQSNVPITVYCL